MIRLIYNLFWPIGLLFFLPGYFKKMIRRGGYREKFVQRLGIYHRDVRHRFANQRSTWLHAVSVGEVNIALKTALGKASGEDLILVCGSVFVVGEVLPVHT